MSELWKGFTRIYFNAWEDAPRFWSVDRGLGTEELTAESVTLEGAGLATRVNVASKEQPRAWLEGEVSVSRKDDGTLVVEAFE
jgi:hypothetical protein